MIELLRFIAKLNDCFASLYPNKASIREVTTKSGLDFLDLDLEGNPRDKWFNILQYIIYKDHSLLLKLYEVVKEDHAEAICLYNIEENFKLKKSRSTLMSNISILTFPKNPKTNFDLANISQSFYNHFHSLSVGLVSKNMKPICSGFVIAKDLIMMPSFALGIGETLSNLSIQFKNIFSDSGQNHIFKSHPLVYDEHHHFMVLKTQQEIKEIEPLQLGSMEMQTNLDSVNKVFIGHCNLQKASSELKFISKNNHNKTIRYRTSSTPDSAGGPIIFDNKVVGMHHSVLRNDEHIGIGTDLRCHQKYLKKLI